MGLLGTVVKVVGALVLVAIGLGAYLYFTDHAAEASVTDRGERCCTITVTPRIAPFIQHEVVLERSVWDVVCVGYDVTYHLQTQRTIVRHEGRVVYDSGTGEKDIVGLTKCGATNLL